MVDDPGIVVRRSGNRGGFLLELSDRLRRLEDPASILGEAAAALGAHLGVSRAGYAEVEADSEHFIIERDWTDGSVKVGTGRRSVSSFGADVVAMLYRGETQRIEDARIDPRVRPADRAAFEEMQIEAAVTVPLVKDGRLVAMFSLQKSSPRRWSDAEVHLIEEVAERTWAAHERAKTAVRLRDSEATLAFLLELSDQTRREIDPGAVLEITARMLGERLGAARVTYGEVDAARISVIVAHAWAGGLPPAGGTYPLAALGPELLADHVAGRTVRIEDVSTDARFGVNGGAFAGKVGFRSAVTVPLVKAGGLCALLSVQDNRPRNWTAAEVRLVEEVAERTWANLERARTAVRLTESEAQLRLLADNMAQLAWIADEQGSVYWYNKRWYEYSGAEPGSMAGEAWVGFVHPEDLEQARDQVARALGTGEAFELVLRFRRADGVYRPFLTRVQPERSASGRVVRWFGTNTDITDRLETERASAFLLALGDRVRPLGDPADMLATSNEMLGHYLGANRVGYAEIDASGDYIEVAHNWTDGTVASVEGRHPFLAFGEDNVALLRAGGTFRLDDAEDESIVPATARAIYQAMSIAAAVSVPLLKDGRLVAVLSVHQSYSRVWTDAEIHLIREVAERTWATLERARAEIELRQSQALLAAFMENSPVGMYLKDEDGRYVMANAGMERIFGRPAAEAIGRTADELFDGVVREKIAAQDAVALAEGRAQVAEQHRPGTEDGSWTLVIRFPIDLGAQGRRVGGFAIDVTEQKQAEARLAESEARLQAFLTYAPASMYLKDAQGRYVLANADVARRLGVPLERVIGHTLAEIAPKELSDYTEACEREVLASGRAETFDQMFELPEGTVHALATRFPVPDGEGRLTQIGGVLIDVTPQKRAEAELARSREALYQSEKLTALGSLLAGVSHELNNPLSVVVGQSMMLEEDATGTRLSERASKIRRASERCAKIVQTFLAMARQKPPERVEVDINAIVQAALDLTAYGARTTGISVERVLAPDLPWLDADADQLHQVMANLLVNAQQALQEVSGPRVLTVVTRRGSAAGTVEVEVADSGPGIPEEIRRRVFEPFYTTKPQGVGTGLGLSFSLGVVEAHGGKLELLDRSSGAAFRLTLPASRSRSRSASVESSAQAGAAQRGHALVVDDEPEITEMVAELLEGAGYRVHIAGSGETAKKQLAARDFDLILSDLRMPDVDGPALYAWVAAERPHLLDRLAFVTGDTLGPNAARFLASANRPCLEKPFTPKALRDFVERVRTPVEGML